MSEITLILSNNIDEIRALVADGFCPVECSIGGESIVDDLQMDHHGSLSHLEAVSTRAYRDHYAARADDPRFVTTGVADGDCAFTVAALAGIIPHPDRVVPDGTPPFIVKKLQRDLTALAETVGRVDVNPIGLNIPQLEGGEILLCWNAMTANSTDTLGFCAGVALWRSLLEGNPAQLGPYFEGGKKAEADRHKGALADMERCGQNIDGIYVLEGSRTWGFDVWYARDEQAGDAESVEGWEHPVVLAWLERGGAVTVGCPNDSVAEELFGPGGLKNVFGQLEPEGWGGREAIGGSPRGQKLTWEQVQAAAKKVGEILAAKAGDE